MNIRTFYCVIMLVPSASYGAQSLDTTAAIASFVSLSSLHNAMPEESLHAVLLIDSTCTNTTRAIGVPIGVISHGL